MGKIVPLPPWATEEEIKQRRKELYAKDTIFILCLMGMLVFLLCSALLLVIGQKEHDEQKARIGRDVRYYSPQTEERSQ